MMQQNISADSLLGSALIYILSLLTILRPAIQEAAIRELRFKSEKKQERIKTGASP